MIFVKDVGQYGIIKDKPPYDLPINAWSDGMNVRAFENSVQKFSGERPALGTPTVPPFFLLPIKTSTDALWVYCGSAAVYVTQGGTSASHKNITRSSGAYNASTTAQDWTGLVFGGVGILNNSGDVPQQWSVDFATPSLLTDLANWPTGYKCKAISGFKQFLIAMDVSITSGSTTRYPRLFKWSHASASNTVPTSWDHTSASLDAGEYDMTKTQGAILNGHSLKDTFIVAKEDSIFGVSYIGPPFIFRFYEISEQFGALSKHAMVETEIGLVIFGTDDIVLCDGQTVQSVTTRKMRRYIYNTIDPANYVNSFLVLNQPHNEVWICYPTSGNVFPNQAVTWNYKENTFGVRDLPTTPHIARGIVNPSDALDWTEAGAWDDDLVEWDSKVYNPAASRLMLANSGSTKLFLLDTTNQFDSSDFTSYIERTGIHLDDPSQIKLVRKVHLNMEKTGQATGEIEVMVGSANSPESVTDWSSPITFNPETQNKVDCLVSGKYLALRVQSSSDVGWKLNSYAMDVVANGVD